MTETAFKIYEEALREQHNRNEARRIRTRVTEARESPHAAGIRWPFELLQNALDAGPRSDRQIVSISIHQHDSGIVFEHDGAAFTSEDLAALLSGGSSKDFQSEVTTGRFGTGFLVTHVLAERAELTGLLQVPTGYEQFTLMLDRSGDEDSILENIHSCNDAIRCATAIIVADGLPSARFEYHLTDDTTLSLGLTALTTVLPFLYLTRPRLGPVRIGTRDGRSELWIPGEIKLEPIEGGFKEYRSITLEKDGASAFEILALRFLIRPDADASALVITERTDSGFNVLLPETGSPRIFREYPLRGSGFVPISFVLDGKFEPDQERSKLLMNDTDKQLLQEAMAAALIGATHAIHEKWEGAHWLARARRSTASFDPTDNEEQNWWTSQMAAFAERLARFPIVECSSRFLPAISSEDWYADFVVPRLLNDSGDDETSVERLWPLVNEATELEPPRRELARDWTEIVTGWHELGLDLSRVTVSTLADYVRGDSKTLNELKLCGDPLLWLKRFLDVVGECWSNRSGVDGSMLTGLLPDQNHSLRSPADLSIDADVSERLKDICVQMGYDFRAQALLKDLSTCSENDLAYLRETISQAVSRKVSEEEVIQQAIKRLDDALPEDKDCNPATNPLQAASIRLLAFLWDERGMEIASVAKKIPLISSNNRAVRWSQDRMVMAPVSCWNESARPFSLAYPPDRILADSYVHVSNQESIDVITPLVKWGIAIPDPLTVDTPVELKERRLAAISTTPTDGVTVSHEEFSQIALLQPEVLNRCQEGIEEARALLGLVLCHIAPHDSRWNEEKNIKGRKARQDVAITVRGALWLADLKFRSWVPVAGEDGRLVKMSANAATLKTILNPVWLDKNDSAIQLLSQWFEFDELELRLLGLAPDEDKRQELRDGLAKLVELGGADPEIYRSLADDIESKRKRSRDVERCRRLGMAVQQAIKLALEKYKLTVKLVDRGFDYEVTTENVIDDGVTVIEVGPYLLEVKATTTGDARLTPLQANTAAQDPSKYVLCVVDLRQISDEDLDAAWDGARVEPLAKVVSDIGRKVTDTCKLISAAKNASVGIRNDSSLRYEVPAAIWEGGVSIANWVFITFGRNN